LSDNYSSFVKNGLVHLSSFFFPVNYSVAFGQFGSSSMDFKDMANAEYFLINVSFDHFLVPTLSLLDLSFALDSLLASPLASCSYYNG
jgi:hypothetical protein